MSEDNEATGREEKEAETVYFSFKMHLNGNLHLTIKREDLIEKLVNIAAGNNIGQESAEARKHEGAGLVHV